MYSPDHEEAKDPKNDIYQLTWDPGELEGGDDDIHFSRENLSMTYGTDAHFFTNNNGIKEGRNKNGHLNIDTYKDNLNELYNESEDIINDGTVDENTSEEEYVGRRLFEGQSTSTLHSLERHIADMDSMSSMERLDLSLQILENATEDPNAQGKTTTVTPFKGGVILGTAMKEQVKGTLSKLTMKRDINSHNEALLTTENQSEEVTGTEAEEDTKNNAATRFIRTSNIIHLGYHEYQSADSVKPIIGPRRSLIDALWFKLHCTKTKCIVIFGLVILVVTSIVITLAVVISKQKSI